MSLFAAIPAFAGVAVVLVSVFGLLRARTTLDKLHFLSPATTLGGPLIGLGLVITSGWNLGSGAIALTVLLLAVTGPVLQSATGHLERLDSDSGGAMTTDDTLSSAEEP